MEKIPFDEKELEIVSQVETRLGISRVYNTPITAKENAKRLFAGDPVWIPAARSTVATFTPSIIPDNIARAFVFSGEKFNNAECGGGKDMFGIDWVYVPEAGGSMVKPGNPTLEDANDWKEVIKFPDIEEWDWEGCAKVNEEYLKSNKLTSFTIMSGAWFERLISFMDFEGAIVALVDEDQQDAVKELFEATTDLMCRIVDKVAEYFPTMDSITVHDDWGSQAQPFFSEATAMEMIVPYMKKLTDHIKSKGMLAILHSCGHTETRVNCYIAAGWQAWTPQPMNDTAKLYEEYGDQIIITVLSNLSEDLTEEQQIQAAKEFAEKYCVAGKPCMISYPTKLAAFEKEFYKQSRLAFLK